MWKCNRCQFKNNNSSENCHGLNCKADKKTESIRTIEKQKSEELRRKRQVLDFCPRCRKETVFEFLRNKSLKQKIYKCTVSNAVCEQKGKSKPVLDFFGHIGSGVVPN